MPPRPGHLIRTSDSPPQLLYALHSATSDREGNDDADSIEYLNARETLNGFTPLHLACISGKLDVVYLLMEAGSNPAVKDKVRRCTNQQRRQAQMDACLLSLGG